jgi:hypothetical protein
MFIGHEPVVEPFGTLEEAERGQQQKRGGGQNRQDYAHDAQREKENTGGRKEHVGN